MADVGEDVVYEDPALAVSQGKRHLLVRDYSMAVSALAQGCALLAGKHGEMADEVAEPYLVYGRALLFLAREESGVLGTGVPGNEENEGEDDEEGEGEGEAEGEEGEAEKTDGEKAGGEKADEKKADGEKADVEKADGEKTEKDKEESKEEVKPAKDAAKDDKKPEEKENKSDEPAAASSSVGTSEAAAGSSADEGASTSKPVQNGHAHENGDDDAEDVENEDDDEANSNLQVAWEVLELAKLILLKRGPPGWKLLAEAHRLLGEVAMESGNQSGALTDLNACLDLLGKLEPVEPRSLAETHYQLGLAYSLGNEFDSSIEQFQKATNLLQERIKELEGITEPQQSDDPFYTVEGEIKELKELLPEIQDKITDMRDFKQQACKLVIEGIKSKVAGGSCSNGAGPSGEGSSSSSGASSSAAAAAGASAEAKPASDISHLVRKKRKTEDDDSESSGSPCKKPVTEKAA